MHTAYDNNLYQIPGLSPDSDPANRVFEDTRYNAAYSSQPNTPSSGQLVYPTTTRTHHLHQGSDEQAFGQSVALFMAGHDMQETLKQFVSSCLSHSRELRAEALQNQHRAVRHLHLQSEASALEAEAATWELLLHMYADTRKMYPAGTGGQQTAIKTVHHQVAEAVCKHPELLQCARVVTWLEALFRKSQDYQAEQEQGPRFNDQSGVWTDTLTALHRQDHNDSLVTELDPDATTRQRASLQRDSGRDEDALNAYLFEFVKAGRVSEAAETCAACGQPWRAASLLGGGPNGPLPLGPAADAQGQLKAMEKLAAEVEADSSIAGRSMWKWTCYQVAEAAAQHASHLSEASGKHEAAVYSTLAGHLHRILPVCHASADILWAYTRCWLESQVDQHLAKSSDKGDLAKGLRLGKDAVAATQRDHPEEVRRVVLDDVADFWPCSSLTEALPGSLEAVLEAAHHTAGAKAAADMEHWQLHQDIILQHFGALLSRFAEDGSTQESSSAAAMTDKQQAVRLRLGAHLGLALGYLPVPVPTTQAQLNIRSEEDIQADPDPDTPQLDSSDDLFLQETANQLLERYASHLIKTDQHTLVPLYACLMRIDKRRTLYASYLHDLTMHSLEHCWLAYRLAQDCFDKWRSGDVETGLELDRIVEQVMEEAFWRMQEGPNQWAASLRWLCFSDSTLQLAVRQANRVLRQLSLGGPAAMQAGLQFAFEAVGASEVLSAVLKDEAGSANLIAQHPHIGRECEELLVWQEFYQLDNLHTEIEVAWAEMDQEDDNQQDTLCELGQRYISHAIELCSSSMFNRIWAGQDSGYDSGSPGHKVQLWVAPAQEASTEAVLSGSSYSWIPSHQMPDFVTAVQAAVDACCVPGITAQVKEAEPHCQAAFITLTVSHAETDFGTEVQCLNALIKATVPVQPQPVLLRVVRMEGPDMCIGALAAMAAYPYTLLRAAQLRQARVPVLVPTPTSNHTCIVCTLGCCSAYSSISM
ncbi:hypothetical protein ABBQ32_008326 [Trebouxia sp. C0010 RCD-2024]